MKKFIFGVIVTLLFSTTSLGQDLSMRVNCNADCLFNDCAVNCPPGTTPRCSCIIGSFSSCKCTGVAARTVQQSVSIKNENHTSQVLAFLEKNEYYDFKQLYQEIFNDLNRKNTVSFEANFDKLEKLSIDKPAETQKILSYIKSLKR